jgi:hypothetical protein
MDHRQAIRDQVVVLIYSIAFFFLLITAAVALDLLAQWVRTLGVAEFTYQMIAWSAHGMLILDMILFFISLLFAGWEFLKGLGK